MVQGDKRKMTDKEKELQAEAIDYYRKQIADLEKENAELNDKLNNLSKVAEVRLANWQKYEKENKELKEINADLKQSLDWANERESENVKRITELQEKISNLLSCKNCPENKGGYICQKEYEDKCLAQKIQYIKELKEGIAELPEYYPGDMGRRLKLRP